jgi:hypothetical protein
MTTLTHKTWFRKVFRGSEVHLARLEALLKGCNQVVIQGKEGGYAGPAELRHMGQRALYQGGVFYTSDVIVSSATGVEKWWFI